MFKRIIWVSLACGLCSCSSITDTSNVIAHRDTDYLSAKSIPPLRIPPGLSSSTIQAHYPVSEKNYPPQKKAVTLVPPELNPGKNSQSSL